MMAPKRSLLLVLTLLTIHSSTPSHGMMMMMLVPAATTTPEEVDGDGWTDSYNDDEWDDSMVEVSRRPSPEYQHNYEGPTTTAAASFPDPSELMASVPEAGQIVKKTVIDALEHDHLGCFHYFEWWHLGAFWAFCIVVVVAQRIAVHARAMELTDARDLALMIAMTRIAAGDEEEKEEEECDEGGGGLISSLASLVSRRAPWWIRRRSSCSTRRGDRREKDE